MKKTEFLREKAMIESLKVIVKELDKLEKTDAFKGVYYNGYSFNKIYSDMTDVIQTIKNDMKR